MCSQLMLKRSRTCGTRRDGWDDAETLRRPFGAEQGTFRGVAGSISERLQAGTPRVDGHGAVGLVGLVCVNRLFLVSPVVAYMLTGHATPRQ
jgi:hypothetical protein